MDTLKKVTPSLAEQQDMPGTTGGMKQRRDHGKEWYQGHGRPGNEKPFL